MRYSLSTATWASTSGSDLGYNFTDFSDDLTDLTDLSYDDQGWFLNVVGTL